MLTPLGEERNKYFSSLSSLFIYSSFSPLPFFPSLSFYLTKTKSAANEIVSSKMAANLISSPSSDARKN
jgi:hypothetical protein